jgi:Spy/CpxP family protein refolding chaperone
MESIKSQKWRVRLSIVAIFLLGSVAGGLAVNLYHRGRPNSSSDRVPPFSRRGGFEAMLKSLNLNEQQQQQVDQILADTRQKLMEIRRSSEPQVSEVRKQTRERLRTILTDDQWNQFQQLIKERQERLDRPDRQHRHTFPEVDQSPHQ